MSWSQPPFHSLAWLPSGVQTRIERRIFYRFRRQLQELNPDHVLSIGTTLELMTIALRRAGASPHLWKRLESANSRRFQMKAADLAVSQAKALVCYDTNAFEAFRRLRDSHVTLVLDMATVHAVTRNQILQEERELWPEYADSIVLPTDFPKRYEQWRQEPDLADLILAGSGFVRRSCVENGISEDKIHVVPYGTDTSAFCPLEAGPEPGDSFRVLFVGSISQAKGIKYLLDAVSALRLPRLELLLCGAVVGRRKWLKRNELNYRFLGYVPHSQMPDVYRMGDVLVLPTLVEGFSQVCLEAMACGIPVITTPNSGTADIIEDGIQGFVVPIRDPRALQEKIETLYADRDMCKWMGRMARQQALSYSWDQYYENVQAVFRQFDGFAESTT